MKKDAEVLLSLRERNKGTTQPVAAARSGMHERTARKYERAGTLPSQMKHPRTWRTRKNPCEQDWPWVGEQVERDPALQGTTLFAVFCAQHPEHSTPTQVRTFQRQIANGKAVHGAPQEVIFEHVHTPGERAPSDFTQMEDLDVILAGIPFPHLVSHLVLTYSNVEAVSVCFRETFEALAEGIENAFWQIDGGPQMHRTDPLSAAIHQEGGGREVFPERETALLRHDGMEPTWNNAGIAQENGDVEHSHSRFKEAVDHAVRVRGSRDVASRAADERFFQDLAWQRNQTRQKRLVGEREALRPLPHAPLAPCRELRVTVSRWSHDPDQWEHVLRPLACDWLALDGARAGRDAGMVPGFPDDHHAASCGGQTAARDPVSPSHLVIGAQAGSLCGFPLSRRVVSSPAVPASLRSAPQAASPAH